MKHFYFQSSKISYTSDLFKDNKFVYGFDYYQPDFQKLLKQEFGMIQTESSCFHLLLGTAEIKGCVWCGSKTEIKKISKNDQECSTLTESYAMICETCGSRGPIMNINGSLNEDEETKEWILKTIKYRYEHPRSWDCGFKNPYEN